MLQADSLLSRFVSYYSGLKNFKLYAWVFFFITAFTTTNFLLVVKDLVTGNAYVFNREANMRYKEIIQATGDTCYINKFSKWPFFIQSSKKENYSFDHMNIFFGKTILYKNE